jgi:hypothetical protein
MSSIKPEQWKKHVDEWRSSDLSAAAFCRQRGLAAWQFAYWKKRVTTDKLPGKALKKAFAEVVVTEEKMGVTAMIVIITRSGCRVEVPI